MFEIMNLKRILKKYESIFSDILFGFEFVNIEDNKIIFEDYLKNQMIGILNDKVIKFHYQNNDYEKQIVLKIPNKDDKNDIKVNEIIKETRPSGTIIEKVERIYGFSKFSHEKRTLVDLISRRYVFNEDIKIIDLDMYDECVNNLNVMKTIFESHMHVLVKLIDSVRWYKDSPYSTHTILNGTDISHIYDIVEGIDKISRIYDLYNGVINERNAGDIFSIHLGLLTKDSLGYKELIGVTDKEDSICGKVKEKLYINQNPESIHELIKNRIGYKKAFNFSDRNSLIEAITYQKTKNELIKEMIEKKLGISYDEFELLDFDEQQKIIKEYHKKNPSKNNKDVIVILGSGENKTFIKAKKGEKVILDDGMTVEVGLTYEEQKQRLEEKLYGKPIAFVKKLTRKIKNIK